MLPSCQPSGEPCSASSGECAAVLVNNRNSERDVRRVAAVDSVESIYCLSDAQLLHARVHELEERAAHCRIFSLALYHPCLWLVCFPSFALPLIGRQSASKAVMQPHQAQQASQKLQTARECADCSLLACCSSSRASPPFCSASLDWLSAPWWAAVTTGSTTLPTQVTEAPTGSREYLMLMHTL